MGERAHATQRGGKERGKVPKSPLSQRPSVSLQKKKENAWFVFVYEGRKKKKR